MSKNYIDIASDHIKAFPVSKRKNNPSAVYTSEINLTNMVKVSSDFNSYVVSDNIQKNSDQIFKDGSYLSFVVDGYYFEMALAGSGLTPVVFNNNLYFYIYKKSDDGNPEFINLVSIDSEEELDDGTTFRGLGISTSNPGEGINYLSISGSWNGSTTFTIDDSCYVKYLSDHISYSEARTDRVPRITSRKIYGSEVSSGEISSYPENPKVGDIFIIYK